jgi:hypothetical protein
MARKSEADALFLWSPNAQTDTFLDINATKSKLYEKNLRFIGIFCVYLRAFSAGRPEPSKTKS